LAVFIPDGVADFDPSRRTITVSSAESPGNEASILGKPGFADSGSVSGGDGLAAPAGSAPFGRTMIVFSSMC
jgi:hypothetical protein